MNNKVNKTLGEGFHQPNLRGAKKHPIVFLIYVLNTSTVIWISQTH